MIFGSRSDPVHVPRKETGVPNVLEIAEEHDDPLEANACASVRKRTKIKAINIIPDRIRVDPAGLRPLLQQHRVVNPLRTARYFLSPHEEVVRTSESLLLLFLLLSLLLLLVVVIRTWGRRDKAWCRRDEQRSGSGE